MSARSVTTVCPPESGGGWLTCGSEDTVTVQPAMRHRAGIDGSTDWFITTEPVRPLTMTFAAMLHRL
jgi:hypothetical protein